MVVRFHGEESSNWCCFEFKSAFALDACMNKELVSQRLIIYT